MMKLNLKGKDYTILGKYVVITDTKEVFLFNGELLGKLPKSNMSEGQITEHFKKKGE